MTKFVNVVLGIVVVASAALCACRGGDKDAADTAQSKAKDDKNGLHGSGESEHALDLAPTNEQPKPKKKRARAASKARNAGVLGAIKIDESAANNPLASLDDEPALEERKRRDDDGDDEAERSGGERSVQTRSWFPETFLFEPLLITDEAGVGALDVPVPDRLTTWRVLALAHSRQGGQAGSTSTFLGTLPAYVDPVVPALLRAGDSVRLPVQMVNTTAESVDGKLTMEASGAQLAGDGPSVPNSVGAERVTTDVTIPARSNIVRYVTLSTDAPGPVQVLARLGETDAVVRSTRVIPTGRPITHTESGTLAAPRAFQIASPENANPALGTARLQVFPGALAILRAELSAAVHRRGVADDAFALLLSGKAPALLRSLGDEPDTEALRKLAILATQRVVRHARTLDPARASLLADAALAHPDNPVLHRLGERAVGYLESNQVPDGTCGGANGWPLQRLLVATADCARAAKGAPRVGVRAQGAFERHRKLIEDPYTAAAILASGVVSENLSKELQELILDALTDRSDGAKVVALPKGVVRADGVAPSVMEATALAILALDDAPAELLADLGAAVLAGYTPSAGWGDGRANLTCIQAVLQLFNEPVPDHVAIVLERDGQDIARGQLTRERIREVLTLEADGQGEPGPHTWRVRAEPAVPGLGFSLALTNYVPWPKQAAHSGLELIVTPPSGVAVGSPTAVGLQVKAPSGRELTIELVWPAGVQVDTPALDKLVEKSTLTGYKAIDGSLELTLPPLAPAQLWSAQIRVIPTLAGTLHSGPTTIGMGQISVPQPPSVWTIAAR